MFPKWLLLILDGVYCGFFGASMGMFVLQFIYRYFVSIGSIHLKSFSDSRIIFWMMIPVAYGVAWGVISYFICVPTALINEQLGEKLLTAFDWEINDIVYLGSYFYQIQHDGSYKIDIDVMIGTLFVWSILASSLIAMIYFGVKCYKKLTKMMPTNNSNSSQKFKNLQTQLFYALITQTLIPVILMHFPITVIYTFSFFNKDLGALSGIASITIALFPALDPLPTMLIVKNYRKTILGCCKTTNVKRHVSSQMTPIEQSNIMQLSSIL